MLEQLLNSLDRQQGSEREVEKTGSGFGLEQGESSQPMILSRINNPRCNQLALLRMGNAVNKLKQEQIELVDYVKQQLTRQNEFRKQLLQDFGVVLAKVTATPYQTSRLREEQLVRRQLQGRESELRMAQAEIASLKSEVFRLREAVSDAELRIDDVEGENMVLQESIFDLEQRIAGIDLEVEKRLKERGRKAEREAAARAKAENQQTIHQLQSELASLRQKYVQIELIHAQTRQSRLIEEEKMMQLREEALKQELSNLQLCRQEAYTRQHQLLTAEQNLSKKTSEIRRKEAELSEWEAELTRREHTLRSNRSEAALLRHIPNDPPIGSLRSIDIKTPSVGQERFRMNTHNNEEDPPNSARDSQARMKQRQWPLRETKVDSILMGLQGRKQNAQISRARQGRDASPYRLLSDLKNRENSISKQSLTNNSSRAKRESASRERDGGLGSKLQRLREQIKKQIESIK